jgi:hypothetical protein
MGNRFDMGGALDGALTRFMPIANSLLGEPCLCKMVCQQFWLYFSGFWKLGFQYLSNPLVIVLPRGFE